MDEQQTSAVTEVVPAETALTPEQQVAADQAAVDALNAKIAAEQASLSADEVTLEQANAELAADQEASAKAAELAKAAEDTAAADVPSTSVEAAVVDKLDAAVAQGIAGFDGFLEHADKVTFFREIAGVASALSTGSRDLLAKLISVL